VIHHDGRPLLEPLEATPPPEIGRVRSAGTNVIGGRVHSLEAGALKHEVPLLVRTGSVLGSAVGFTLGLVAAFLLLDLRPVIGGMLAGMALGPAIALWRSRSRRTTTFVGEHGLARVTTAPLRLETLSFAQAVAVEGGFVVERERSAFGVAATAGCRIDLTWRGPGGERLFRIVGRFDERHPPPPANTVHFARAALEAWEAHARRRAA
jgi:hypothetical protein